MQTHDQDTAALELPSPVEDRDYRARHQAKPPVRVRAGAQARRERRDDLGPIRGAEVALDCPLDLDQALDSPLWLFLGEERRHDPVTDQPCRLELGLDLV